MPRDLEDNLDDLQVSPSKSNSSRRSSRSLKPETVIIRTGSKYHPWLVALLVLSIVPVLISLDYALKDEDYKTAWGLVWSLLFVVVVYLLVLPKSVDVRSNGVVGVRTLLMTYKFKDIVRAYQSDFSADELFMPRIKFATSWQAPHRVVLCRKNGKWDVLVSPVDVDEFLDAINSITSGDDQHPMKDGHKSPKRDLSSL